MAGLAGANILILSRLTFLNALRERFYKGLFFLLAFFFVFAFYLTVLSLAEPERVLLEVGFLSILLTGVLLIFYFGIFEFKRQEESRGIHIFLSKPISRQTYILGHLLGVTGVLWIYTGVAVLLLLGVYAILFGHAIPGGFGAFVQVSLELLLLNVLALFSSVLFSSSIVSVFAFLSLFVIGHSLAEARALVQTAARPATQFATETLYYLFPSFNHFNFSSLVVYKESFSTLQWCMIAGYCAVYSLVFLALSLFLFNRKEIE
ncbi:MAG: ABC transporter permease subunit [bacterium]